MAQNINYGPGTTPGQGGMTPAEVRQAYSKKLLNAARPALIHAQFCDDQPVPKNQGNTMNMRRFELLAPATTPLVEGITPSGNIPAVTPVSVQVAQYGDYVQVTDVLTWEAIDPMLDKYADILGFQSGNTIDILARTVMAGGTNVIYANGRTSRGAITSGDKCTSVEIKKGARTLRKSFVRPRQDNCYIGICSPDTTYDLMSITEWLNVKEYGDSSKAQDLYHGEVGELYRVRFEESPLAAVFAGAGSGGIDVHGTIVFGMDAFVKSSIEGENLENIVKPLGSAGAADPLNQRATSGWKCTFGATVANQLYCVRLEHAVTP